MLARRLLLVVLAVAAAVHASAQCLSEPQISTLQAVTNNLPSQQQLCFNTLSVILDGCSIKVTSYENGCNWLQLSGDFTGTPTTSVQASGPLAPGARDSLFEFSMIGNYDNIKLVIVGEADANQATYKVAAGRLLQIRAALNNPVTSVDGSSSTASTSTANCQGYATLVRIAVSKNCPWMAQNDCLRSYTAVVSNCYVYISNGRSQCPRFIGQINSAGTQAAVSVSYATNSRSQSAPPYGRKMLQDGQLSRAGRGLSQSLDEGQPWYLFVAGQSLGLRQGTCGIFFTVTSGPGVLGVD